MSGSKRNSNQSGQQFSASNFLWRSVGAILLIRIFSGLPTFLKMLFLLIAGFGPCRRLFLESFQLFKMLMRPLLRSLWMAGRAIKKEWRNASAGYTRFSHIMWDMSNEEFDKKFGAGTQEDSGEPESPPAQNHSFVPETLCVQPISEGKAEQLANAWWSGTDGGEAGEERLAELLSSISSKDPTKHTCLLNEYEELRLPAEVPVLSALIAILNENGIAADLTEDEQLIVSWGQTLDGLEAGQY